MKQKCQHKVQQCAGVCGELTAPGWLYLSLGAVAYGQLGLQGTSIRQRRQVSGAKPAGRYLVAIKLAGLQARPARLARVRDALSQLKGDHRWMLAAAMAGECAVRLSRCSAPVLQQLYHSVRLPSPCHRWSDRASHGLRQMASPCPVPDTAGSSVAKMAALAGSRGAYVGRPRAEQGMPLAAVPQHLCRAPQLGSLALGTAAHSARGALPDEWHGSGRSSAGSWRPCKLGRSATRVHKLIGYIANR